MTQRTTRRIPATDRLGRSALHYAVIDNRTDAVAVLLAEGADPNLPDRDGWTPLHFAAQIQSVPISQLLLQHGADVNARDTNGNTPLFRAVFTSRGAGEIILSLRSAGADPNALNRNGVSPLSLARTIANYDVRKFFTDLP